MPSASSFRTSLLVYHLLPLSPNVCRVEILPPVAYSKCSGTHERASTSPLRVAFLLFIRLVLYRRVGELVSMPPGGSASMADRVGQQLGNYRLIQLLGQLNPCRTK